VYTIGSALVAVTAIRGVTGNPPTLWGCAIGLVLVCLGTGGIKPCVSAMMGDQFTPHHAPRLLASAFSLFYLMINTGSLTSMFATPVIRARVSYPAAFGVTAAILALATLVFLAGAKRYVKKPANGENMIPVVAKMCVVAAKRRRAYDAAGGGGGVVIAAAEEGAAGSYAAGGAAAAPTPISGGEPLDTVAVSPVPSPQPQPQPQPHSQPQPQSQASQQAPPPGPASHWLDHAKGPFDPELVDGAKAVFGVFRVFATLPIFWCLYDQSSSRWVFQARRTNRHLGSYEIEPDQVPVLNPLLILLIVPLFDKVIYPALDRRRWVFRPLHRVMVGMMLTALSFLCAALLETSLDNGASVHVVAMVPQYLVLTIGEVLVSVTCLEFAFTQAPPAFKGVVMASWSLTTAIGNLIVVMVAEARLTTQATEFLIFSVLMVATVALFWFLTRGYRYVDEKRYAAVERGGADPAAEGELLSNEN
jgi:dipeptide/tripeptide permease